ncbi:MAG: hypothetical protein ACI3W5_04885 [Faecousia sp.]
MLLRNCGESVTPQRADVGIGPYGYLTYTSLNSNRLLCCARSIITTYYNVCKRGIRL